LQQDNASIHTSASTRNFFERKRMRMLGWPARSPDLNPMENLWGIVARKVYAHGKQYGTLVNLKKAICAAWNSIPLETVQGLINSMKNRIYSVIFGKGGFTRY